MDCKKHAAVAMVQSRQDALNQSRKQAASVRHNVAMTEVGTKWGMELLFSAFRDQTRARTEMVP